MKQRTDTRHDLSHIGCDPGLDVDGGTETVWALSSAETHWLLTVGC
jgi:hypothetical protein